MPSKKTAAKAASNLPAEIDPEAEYRVELIRSIKLHGIPLRPADTVTVKGKVLVEIAEAVGHAEKAE